MHCSHIKYKPLRIYGDTYTFLKVKKAKEKSDTMRNPEINTQEKSNSVIYIVRNVSTRNCAVGKHD